MILRRNAVHALSFDVGPDPDRPGQFEERLRERGLAASRESMGDGNEAAGRTNAAMRQSQVTAEPFHRFLGPFSELSRAHEIDLGPYHRPVDQVVAQDCQTAI